MSKSSPPRCVSPLVDLTSKRPPAILSIDISKVPPPRSNTAMFLPSDLSIPKDKAAAVGSLIIRLMLSPAI